MQDLVGCIVECDLADNCRNSISNKGSYLSKCRFCKFAANQEDFPEHHYSAINKKIKHPSLEKEKYNKKVEFAKSKINKRLNRNKQKIKLLKKAVKSEENSFNALVKKSINSGRKFRDADIHADLIAIDSKMQSTRVNPEVNLYELDKVQTDAHNGHKLFGVLLIRNKHDRGVVVMNEEDFKVLLERLK